MSPMRWRRGTASRCSEASRQSVGSIFRRLAVVFALEWQPHGGGSVRLVRNRFSARDASVHSRKDFAHHFDFSDLPGLWAALAASQSGVAER